MDVMERIRQTVVAATALVDAVTKLLWATHRLVFAVLALAAVIPLLLHLA
jgi:hypothetical protein